MKTPNEILDLFVEMDSEICERERRLEQLRGELCEEDGKILATNLAMYNDRCERVLSRFRQRFFLLEKQLDELCSRIRLAQPDLTDITTEGLRLSPAFPRHIVLGRIHVRYENKDIYVPRAISFPFSAPVYIDDIKSNWRVHSLLLRLLWTLPVGRVELHVYDGMGLGQTVSPFNALFSERSLFLPERSCHPQMS